jgi:hypothetical protein
MKTRPYNDYTLSGIILLAGAALLLALGYFTNRGDLTSATVILSGVACFLSGVFMLSFAREDPPGPEVISLLPVAGTLNVCRIGADLGVRGDAWFLPANDVAGGVKEFIPAEGESLPGTTSDFSFVTEETAPGLIVIPAALPLVTRLEASAGLRLPETEPELVSALREICEDVLELSEHVEISREGDTLVATVKGYRLFDGCLEVVSVSPKCCTMHPCGICSLIACLLARAEQLPWRVDSVRLEERSRGLSLVFRAAAVPGPTGEGPGSSR